MPEPFKNQFNPTVIKGMADALMQAWPEFDGDTFVTLAVDNLDKLALKERSKQITDALKKVLPEDFEHAAAVIFSSLVGSNVGQEQKNKASTLVGIRGWAIMPMADYVGLYGLHCFDLSMQLFKEMTKKFSAEFGIRYFLLQQPERVLAVLKTWVDDPNEHVRRLVSEGTRPRLPWGIRLPGFVENPLPLLPLLEELKDDDKEYVRRSVANNLNDIAKDHPDVVAEFAERWFDSSNKNNSKLIKHGCRTLVKNGHKRTLIALGYGTPNLELLMFKLRTPEVNFGGNLEFELSFTSTSSQQQQLIIDYAIHHRKANGSTSAKVFKWKVVTLQPFAPFFSKRKHGIREITTRKYYPGNHRVEIFVNGVSQGCKSFELIM